MSADILRNIITNSPKDILGSHGIAGHHRCEHVLPTQQLRDRPSDVPENLQNRPEEQLSELAGTLRLQAPAVLILPNGTIEGRIVSYTASIQDEYEIMIESMSKPS